MAAIVIDNGSGTCKAGFAGKEVTTVFPTIIGKHKNETFIGLRRVQGCVANETFNYPIEQGIIKNWDEIEAIWQHIFDKKLAIDTKEHAVLVTEAVWNLRKNKEKTAEIMFEKFKVPGLYIGSQGVLSLTSTGRTTGVVLDCGDGCTQIVPIFEGIPINKGISRLEIAGKVLTNNLKSTLAERGYCVDLKIAQEFKEKLCYVAVDVDRNSFKKFYKLPDGYTLDIGHEQYNCPEVLFKPWLANIDSPGIHEALIDSIMKCSKEIHGDLFSNITVSGGTSMLRGFISRLRQELTGINFRIHSLPNNRQNSAWIGGSMIASSSTFNEKTLTKAQYEEYGAKHIHKKKMTTSISNFEIQQILEKRNEQS